MWQKLNRIDTYELEKARIQLLNAIQLVSAVPRSYSNSIHPLVWNNETRAIECINANESTSLHISLDAQQFVLSLIGEGDHREHLVLSGITYPMSFGWMKIKLDSFNIDSDIFDDSLKYDIERSLGPDDELSVTSQQIFDEIVIYFSNAHSIFNQLAKELGIPADIYVDPKNLSLNLSLNTEYTETKVSFTPGDPSFLEPYYSVQVHKNQSENLQNSIPSNGFWNNKEWMGMVLLAGDFLSIDPEKEKKNVHDFLIRNCQIIIKK